jgi:hypothetical protein
MMDTPQTREADACWDGAADGKADDGGGGSDGGASECESSGDFISCTQVAAENGD